MNTLVWCVECEKMVEMEIVRLKNVEFCGHVVEFNVLTDGGEVAGTELDFCEFPLGFTFVAPPDVQPDWIEHVVEPGKEVMEPEQEPYFDLSLPEEYIASVMYHKGLEA